MKVLVHPDPVLLEEELLDRVAGAQEEDALAPVLVLVPTARLAGHVQRRLLERRRAVLAVEVLHYEGLVDRLLSEGEDPSAHLASPRHQATLLQSLLAERREGDIARFVARRPGALSALLGTLRDLRKAGIPPAEALTHLDTPRERDLGEIYREYDAALHVCEKRGWMDEAGRARRALATAGEFAGRFHAVFHHGAYELIGVHLDLLRALGRSAPLTVLLPVQQGAPATAYAEAYARRHLLEEGEDLEPLAGRRGGLLGNRLGKLFLAGARPDPLPLSGSVVFRNAQGEEAEARLALRHALESVRGGTPAEEIALVARGLSPYAAALEEALEEELRDASGGAPPPWTSSLGTPLGREPLVRDLLRLLRAGLEDFPRAATAEVLASPRIRWETLLPGRQRPPIRRAEEWSRRAGILGGKDEWSEGLLDWASREDDPRREEGEEERRAREERRVRRVEGARWIGEAVVALARRLETGSARTWSEHAAALESLSDELLSGPEGGRSSPATEALRALIEEMRELEELLSSRRPVSFEEMLEWLERAVAESELRPRSRDLGGLRVLDAMQARGLTHRRVLLVGLHAGSFPRVPREDPFLRDATRRRLREATGRPLPVKGEGEEEERLLLCLMLGSAREGLEISWQRADGGGRTRSPSLALREVARLVHGRPELDLVLGEARGLPAHPEARLERLAEEPGLLSPAEAALFEALRLGAGESVLRLGRRHRGLVRGLELLRATESFAPGRGEHDGRVGRGFGGERSWSVSALESLGRCPLQFFFRYVLRVYELQEAPRMDQVASRDLGEKVHLILERLYGGLAEEGYLETGAAAGPARRAARERLPALWKDVMGELESRLSRRLPLLWRVSLEAWREALERFVDQDLERIAGFGAPQLEISRSAELDLGSGVQARVDGRFDRVLAGAEGPVVGDYKTSGRLDRRVKPAEMLKGRALQVPLYQLLAGEGSEVELLGVGPSYGIDEEITVASFSGFAKAEQSEGFRETLRVLLRLARAGRFPLLKGRHCEWCAWRPACRRNHPPTRHREEVARDTAAFRSVGAKNTRRPLIETGAGEDQGEERA